MGRKIIGLKRMAKLGGCRVHITNGGGKAIFRSQPQMDRHRFRKAHLPPEAYLCNAIPTKGRKSREAAKDIRAQNR